MGKKTNNKRKGIIIELEGGNGSGKSTLSKMVYEQLKSDGYPIELMREPGGSDIAEKIRDIAVYESLNSNGLSGLTSFFLFMASRAQLIYDRADKALEDNKILFYDRYEDSTRVYQGILNNIGLRAVDEMIKKLFYKYKPDITILLDVDTELGLERANRDGVNSNSYDKLPLEYHNRVNEAYRDIFKSRSRNDRYCHIIDSNRDLKEVYDDLYKVIKKDLDKLYNKNQNIKNI